MTNENAEAVDHDEDPAASSETAPDDALELELDPSRVQTRLLEDPTRRAIVRILSRTPGLNVSQLRRRADVARNTMEFHLRRLSEADLVVTEQREGSNEVLCFLPTDACLWERQATRVLFGRRSNRQVALFVEEHPGSSTTQIAEAVGLEPVTVLHHLKTLRDHALVERVREGNEVAYFPSPTLEGWVEDVDGNYERRWGSGTDSEESSPDEPA